MEKQNVYQDQLLSLMAEMVLDKAIRDFEIRKLYDQIDYALQDGDQERFLSLTKELNGILNER